MIHDPFYCALSNNIEWSQPMRSNETQLTDWLWLAFNKHLTPLQKQALLNKYHSAQHVLQNIDKLNFTSEQIQKITTLPQKKMDAAVDWLNQANDHHILTYQSQDYPMLLKQIATPPPVLFVWGDTCHLNKPQIAIVGSRKATPNGLKHAFNLATNLANQHIVITSGLAYGIDAQAHYGALSCQQPTIAVLGSGLNHLYPHKHRQLAEKIAKNGAVISELSVNSPPKPFHFPQRNRIISGLSLGTAVIEAQQASGSLITARYALDQNRLVFAMPGAVTNKMSSGCHQLIKQGAILITEFIDIMNEIDPQRQVTQDLSQCNIKQQDDIKLDKNTENLLEYIDYALMSVDELGQLTGASIEELNSRLSFLELNGYITKAPGGYIRVK